MLLVFITSGYHNKTENQDRESKSGFEKYMA